MNPIDISIIMPVYNSKAYLETAVHSILSQDYDDFELILVDDGSSDGSEILCDEFGAKDCRVVVIHKTNGGICHARNTGLKHAKGKYIMFCDNDDIYLPHAIRDNVSLAKKYDADLVKYSRLRVRVTDKGTQEESFLYKYDFHVFKDQEVVANYGLTRNISSGIWCNLYKREIIEKYNIQFREDFKFGFEDMYFNVDFYQYAHCVVTNPKVYYHWIQRDGHSTSKKYSDNMLYALDECLKLEYRYIKEKDIIQKYPGNWEDLLTNYYVFGYYLTLLNPNSGYSMAKKVSILKQFRDQECFHLISKRQLKAFKKMNIKRYLILKLFLMDWHRFNFFIVDFYSRKISKIV